MTRALEAAALALASMHTPANDEREPARVSADGEPLCRLCEQVAPESGSLCGTCLAESDGGEREWGCE